MINKIFYCYLLFSISKNRTYIGITNNLLNRLNEHNGINKHGVKMTKGAKSTRVTNDWFYHTVIGPFESLSQASSFEWYWKHKINKKNKWIKTPPTINNKMKRLLELLLQDEWIKYNIVININRIKYNMI